MSEETRPRCQLAFSGVQGIGGLALRRALVDPGASVVAVFDPLVSAADYAGYLTHNRTHGRFDGTVRLHDDNSTGAANPRVVVMEVTAVLASLPAQQPHSNSTGSTATNCHSIRWFTGTPSDRVLPWRPVALATEADPTGIQQGGPDVCLQVGRESCDAAVAILRGGCDTVVTTAASAGSSVSVPLIMPRINEHKIHTSTCLVRAGRRTATGIAALAQMLNNCVPGVAIISTALMPLDALSDEPTLSVRRSSLRCGLARATVPRSSAAGTAVGEVLPALKSQIEITGSEYVTPASAEVAMLSLRVLLKEPRTIAEICTELESHCGREGMPGFNVGYVKSAALVSSDFACDEHSVVIDEELTKEANASRTWATEGFTLCAWCSDWGHAAELVGLALTAHLQKVAARNSDVQRMPLSVAEKSRLPCLKASKKKLKPKQ